ncbi:ABC transporter substrate-binding protein [Mesorhizobium sp. SP-1A]|uniref:ABC transporter substrate-binding protein n=1 Tax=Mesorhizobium sp. SP-1A TaxID=3077840 RepID=UPI0028F70EB9|nr:ABC transporter substrate-binding protein [Mesorhizobium sp. SP-1A]
MSPFRIISFAIATMVLALSPAAAKDLTHLKVGMLPSVNSAAIILGIEKGFFKEEGLDIEPIFMGGGSELTVALMSGATQISHIGSVNSVIARSRGLPIKVLTAYLKEHSNPDEAYMQIVVRPDSGIKTIHDLEGKTIAVNEVRAYGETVVKAAFELAGMDPNSVKLVEVPFPDMANALESKQVDAIWTLEPFLTRSLDAGDVQIDAPAIALGGKKNFFDGAWMSTETYIAENPQVIDSFVRAMNRSTEYAAQHPDEIRNIIPTYTKVKADLASRVRLPVFDSSLDPEMVDVISQHLIKYGITDKAVSAADLFR